MKYRNIKHWEEVLNIDDIMNEYLNDKKHIISLLEDDPEKLTKIWKEILCNDDTCQMNMHHVSDFACANCLNMSHIIDYRKIGEPFNILTGSLAGQDLLLTETKVPYAYLTLENNKMKGDDFTMKVLFLWIIEDLFYNKIPNIVHLKTAFICHNKGYTLYHAPTIDHELCDFDCVLQLESPPSIYGILSQLIVIFNELKNIEFVFGRPSIYSFLFDKKPCSFLYQQIPIKCQYTLCLANCEKSSAKIHNLYLSSGNRIGELQTNNYARYIEVKEDQYKIKNHFNIEEIRKKPGLDFYFTLLSMYENQDFLQMVREDVDALALINTFWNHEEMIKQGDFSNQWLYKDPVSVGLSKLH